MQGLKKKSFRTLATVFIAFSATLASSAQAEAALLGPSSDYIVQITPEARAVVESAVKKAGGTLGSRYQYAFDGFVVRLPDMLLPLLKKIPNVLTIEKDQPVSGLAIQQNQSPTTSWGLDRIDQREVVSTAAGYQSNYGYRSAGAGSTIYIGDSGIYPHDDLAGRISSVGFSGIADGNGTVDCNGHGTHVATTAAGTKYGVAKSAKVVPVRILDCSGRGSYATVIAGLDWIMSPLNTNPKTQSVLNLSIGGGFSSAINDAILRLTNAGVTVVAAAGNDNLDACTKSPASAPSAITVGATGSNDSKAYFSNWGRCVDIHAPGYSITGGWKDAPSAVNTISGTSMASPHVAGAAAVYLGLNPAASVAQVASALAADSTKNAVTGLPADTINNLVYVSPTDGGAVIVPPAVQISTLSGITYSQAQANVEINPNNAPTTARIEYATDSVFAQIVKSINLTSSPLDGGAVISLPVIFDGLTPSTTYYFRAIATNESGSFTTPVGTFKSLAPPVTPPAATSSAATQVTGWSARLNGTVNANNGSTAIYFLYGTDPDFLTNTQTGLPATQTVSGNTTRDTFLDISFLNGSTTYYYKVIASNSAASVQSQVASFTTPAVLGVKASVETIRPTGGLNTPATTITGKINPNGQTTSVKLIWDMDSSMTIVPKSVILPLQYTGIDTVTVTADMTGLTPGYRYYYRFEATNAAGVTKPTPLTNTGNPLMPVINSTTASLQTQTSLQLNANVNGGASNIRVSFIYGSDPKLETGTITANGTPYAITNPSNNQVILPVTGLTPNQTIYYRVKILAYTGPLSEKGGILLGPIMSTQTLMPTRPGQTITFTLPTSRFFGGAATPLTATTTSGLPITYTTSTPSVCKIVTTDSGTVLTYTEPIGTATSFGCSVTASQAGDINFMNATPVTRNITWSKESTVILNTLTAPISITGSTLNFNVVSNSQRSLQEQLAGTTALAVTSKTPGICQVSDTAYVGSAASHTSTTVKAVWNGTCQLSVVFAGNSYWLPYTALINLTVSGVTTPQEGANAYQSITFPTISNTAVGSLVTLAATATSKLPITYTSTTPATCSVTVNESGTAIVQAAAGISGDGNICAIKAVQRGDSRWAPAVDVIKSFTWLRKSQVVTYTLPTSRFYSGAPTPLVGSATSGLPVTFKTTTPSVCQILTTETGTVLTYTAPISTASSAACDISATQVGDSIYAPSGAYMKRITFNKEATVIRATLASPITLAGTSLDLTVKSSPQALLNEDVSGTTPLVVTSRTPKVCSVDTPTYVGSATSHTRVTVKALWNGSCQLQYTFAGNSYWLASITYGAFTVSGITTPQPGANAAQYITFNQPSSTPVGTNVVLTVSSTSKLPVTVVSTTPATCVVTQNSAGQYIVTSVEGLVGDANSCSLQASQPGDTSWAPATNTIRTFKWTRLTQTISFVLPSYRYFGGAPTKLVATSTSGLPVTFATTTPAICQVQIVDSASVLSYVTPLPTATSSSCYVVASQAGNEKYLPANSLGRSISWQKESTIIKTTWSSAPTVAGSTLDLNVVSSVQPGLYEALAGTTPLVVTSRTPKICVVDTPTYVGSSTSHTRVTVKAIWNGYCTLSVSFAGNSYWLPNTSMPGIGITGMTTPQPGASASQYVSVSTPSTMDIGGSTNIFPTATSKLPVSMTSLTPLICSVTPNATGYLLATVAGVTGNGNICSIQGSQAGTDAWAAAPLMTRNITVNKAAMAVRLLRTSTIVTPTMPALLVAGTAYVNGPLNKGLNSIGNFLTVTSSTPAVCSITPVADYQTTVGTYSQITVKSIANGTCSIAWSFAETGTQKAATYSQNLTVTGVK